MHLPGLKFKFCLKEISLISQCSNGHFSFEHIYCLVAGWTYHAIPIYQIIALPANRDKLCIIMIPDCYRDVMYVYFNNYLNATVGLFYRNAFFFFSKYVFVKPLPVVPYSGQPFFGFVNAMSEPFVNN
jgi:hypothetical protein